MVDASIVTTLAYLHILAGMSWLGGAALFVSVVTPGLRKTSPNVSLEFLAKIGPGALRFFMGASTATVVFGLALYAVSSGLNATVIDTGIVLGLTAYLIVLLVIFPSFRKADRLAQQILASGQSGPPPPEMAAAVRRGGVGTVLVLLLLLVTVAFMVASGFLF